MTKIIEILDQEHLDYCSYGQPDGPDSYIKECDCCDDLQQYKKDLLTFDELGIEAKALSIRFEMEFQTLSEKMYQASLKLKDFEDEIKETRPNLIELFDALKDEHDKKE